MVEIIEEDRSEPKLSLKDRIGQDKLNQIQQVQDNNDEPSDNETQSEVYEAPKQELRTYESDEEQDKRQKESKRRDIDELAESMGYNPNYQGENRKTPEEFVEEAYKKPKVMAERYSRLHEENRQNQEMIEYQDKVNRLLMMQLDDKIDLEREKMARAKDDYDFDAFERSQEKINALEKERAEINIPNQARSNINPEQYINDYAVQSPWYAKKGFEDVTSGAERYIQEVWTPEFKKNPPKSQQDLDIFLDDLERFVRRTYPQKFYNQPKKVQFPNAPVASGKTSNATNNATVSNFSLNRLSTEHRKIYDHMVNRYETQFKSGQITKEQLEEKKNRWYKTVQQTYGQ